MKARWFWLLVFFILVLGACKPAPEDETFGEALATFSQEELVHTVEMRLTYAQHETMLHQPTATPTPLFTPTYTPWPTVVATIARTPTSDATPTAVTECNRAGAGVPFDVTIPDNTTMYAGETFTKTWRVVNSGSCKWTRLYKLVFYSQNAMGAQYDNFLQGEVLPGQAIDLSLQFTAPPNPGTYQGNWMLQDPDGHLFGLGMNADVPFYVRIIVSDQATPTPKESPTPTETPEGTPESTPTP